MVPKGWSYCRLEELSKIIDCKHRTPVYVADGVPVISPGTIKWGPIDLVTPVKRVTYEDYQSLMDHCQIDIGDLVMSRNQSVGVVSYIDKNQPFVLGQDTVLLKPRHIDSSFLFQFFQSVPFQRAITKQSGGSTFARINLGVIKELTIVTPPLPEQRKIAQILSIWDKAIATTERLLANKQQQKKALMQRLLTGKQRFSGFEGEWKGFTLSDLATIDTGFAFKSSDFTDIPTSVPIIRMSDFKDGGLDLSMPARVPLSLTENLDRFALRENDFVFGMSGSLSNYAWVKASDLPCFLNQRVGRITANHNADQMFVTYLYLSELVQQAIIDKAAGAAQLNISVSDLRSIKIKAPSLAEQTKIATVLSSAALEVTIIKGKVENLKQQKKALMQQLLTGKRRVKVDEAAA